MIIIYALWILYAILEGIREGFLWHYRLKSDIQDDDYDFLHDLFFIQRLIVAIVFSFFVDWTSDGFLECIPYIVALGLCFPFFHNGYYYNTRNNMDPTLYPKRFRDFSTTSTARTAKLLTFRNRLIGLILSISILTYLYL